MTASAGGSVWVFGTNPLPQGNELRLARWDGRRWHKIPSPEPPLPEWEDPRVIVTDLVATGPSDVWVAANIEVADEEPGYLLLLHWNGAAWSWQRGSKESGSGQLVPDGRGGFWLTRVEKDDLQHMAGRRRTPVRLPLAGDHGVNLVISQVPGSTRVWGVGVESETEYGNLIWSSG
ncbi:hypothetical protein GCM10020219_036350 [Nonomuraea dietziae]